MGGASAAHAGHRCWKPLAQEVSITIPRVRSLWPLDNRTKTARMVRVRDMTVPSGGQRSGDGTDKGCPRTHRSQTCSTKPAQSTKSWLRWSQRSQKLPRKHPQFPKLQRHQESNSRKPSRPCEERQTKVRQRRWPSTDMTKKGPSCQKDIGRYCMAKTAEIEKRRRVVGAEHTSGPRDGYRR